MADDIIVQGFVQGSAQGIAARLRAKDNGNGTWTLVAAGLTPPSSSTYLRPGGTTTYHRSDGTSIYIRP